MSSSPEITSVGTAISSSRSGGSGSSSSSASQTSSGQSSVSSNARRCMARTASRTAGGHDVRSAVRAVDPGHHVRLGGAVQVTRLDGLPLELPERGELLGPLGDERASRRGQHEGRHRTGALQRQLDRHPRPEGAADDVGPLDPEGVEGRQYVGARRPGTGRPLAGLAEPPQVDWYDVPGGRQGRPDGVPHPPVGDAGVEEQDRRGAGGSGTFVGEHRPQPTPRATAHGNGFCTGSVSRKCAPPASPGTRTRVPPCRSATVRAIDRPSPRPPPGPRRVAAGNLSKTASSSPGGTPGPSSTTSRPPRPRRGRPAARSGRRVGDGVLDQVADQPPQLVGVADHGGGRDRRGVDVRTAEAAHAGGLLEHDVLEVERTPGPGLSSSRDDEQQVAHQRVHLGDVPQEVAVQLPVVSGAGMGERHLELGALRRSAGFAGRARRRRGTAAAARGRAPDVRASGSWWRRAGRPRRRGPRPRPDGTGRPR